MNRPLHRVMHQLLSGIVATAVLAAGPAHAFTQETHRRIVLDAVAYMRANPITTNYHKLADAAVRAGYTIDQFAAVLAQSAADVDLFADTYLCGAITGDCEKAPVWGIGTAIARYSSFWHFQDHAHGPDVHGNRFGGYNYGRLAIKGDVDELAAAWLWNDYLDDGSGGLHGLFGDGSRYDTYHITEASYRLGGYSSPSMYADYQNSPFQPITNLGQFWFSEFLERPTVQTLGFVLHTTDTLVPQHTWATFGHNHPAFESWVQYYYDIEQLNSFAGVQAALGDFAPLAADALDIRPLLYQTGNYSYTHGSLVLSSTDHSDRLSVAHQLIPHATALVVIVLNRAAERMVR